MNNIRNFGIAEGRVTKDPVVFKNSDGSRKVMVTVAAQDNFKGKDGQRDSQFISLEGFIPAQQQSNGVYDYIHKGDKVGIEYTVRNNNNTDKDGNAVYGQVLFIQSVDLKEGKSVTDARQAANAENENTAPAPMPAPEAPADETIAGKDKGKGKKAAAKVAPEDAPFGTDAN